MYKLFSIFKIIVVITAGLYLTSCTRIISNEEFDLRYGKPADRYEAEFIDGKKVGFERYDRKVVGDKIIYTTAEITTLDLLGKHQKTTFSRKVETAEGKVLEFMNNEFKGKLNDSGTYDIFDSKTGKKLKEIVIPENAIFGEKGQEELICKLREGEEFETVLFDGNGLKTVDTKIIKGGKKKVKMINDTAVLTEVHFEFESSIGTIKGTGYYDEDCKSKKTQIKIGSLSIVSIECDREFAISENDGQINNRQIIECPGWLSLSGSHYKVKYLLKPIIDDFQIVSTDNQKVTAGPDGHIILTVQPVKAEKGKSFPYSGKDPSILEALKPTDLLECDDELIIKLAHKAVGKTKDAKKAAKKIEAFVLGYLSKKDIKEIDGFPTALQTAKAKKGDCKGHAVLTAAMCRAVGIPSRVVAGYVYCSYHAGQWHVFVAHAWTEAYIGDKWVGLDATRNTWWGLFKSYDAAYIATSVFSKKSDGVDIAANLATFEIEDFKKYRK